MREWTVLELEWDPDQYASHKKVRALAIIDKFAP